MGIEWIIAIIAALLIVCAVVIIFIKQYTMNKSNFSVDSIVGQRCVVTEKIDNYAGCGQVKIKGQYWSACGFYDDDIFECGDILKIVAIEGVKVVCKR